jgi:capping protein (actin filament) muscle Z-line, alpha
MLGSALRTSICPISSNPSFFVIRNSCGDWISKWEINSNEVKGDLSVLAHYYEEGNVQLKNTNKFSAPVNLNINSPSEAAKEVVGVIEKLENKHEIAMEKLYEQMPDLFFKAMRR